jgi:hypothetical protein
LEQREHFINGILAGITHLNNYRQIVGCFEGLNRMTPDLSGEISAIPALAAAEALLAAMAFCSGVEKSCPGWRAAFWSL